MMKMQRKDDGSPNWWPLGVFFFLGIGFWAISLSTGYWAYSALPVGLLFGFFLQKGSLCGASAFSEVLLMKDWGKVIGIWVCIVTSMSLFAISNLAGWTPLPPKPLLWVNYALGGLVFGIGTVLAGGCISGCLYKAATGNINSIVALLAIPLGIGLVEFGPLNGFFSNIKSIKATSPTGGPVTLSSLSGVPFWVWAAIFTLATILFAVLWVGKHRRTRDIADQKSRTTIRDFFVKPWKPWHAGLAIGLLALPAFFSSLASGRNYPLGVTHGVLQLQELVTDSQVVHDFGEEKKAGPPSTVAPSSAKSPPGAPAKPAAPAPRKIVWWLVLLVVGLFFGSLSGAFLSGQAKLQPKPPEQVLTAIPGGLLVGIGAGLASGCVVGNILSGIALLSVGMLVFTFFTILGNWLVTHFYLMGGTWSEFPLTIREVFRRSRAKG